MKPLAILLFLAASASGATLVQETNWRDASGRLIDGGCSITPIGEFVAPSTWRIAGVPVYYAIKRGVFAASLIPTDTATPSGQYYTVSCVINSVTRPSIWLVPTTGATLAVKDVEVSAAPPQTVMLSPSQATACVNPQSGPSYTFADTDRDCLVTGTNAGAQAYTLPQAGGGLFVNKWFVDVENRGAGAMTITAQGTSTIDGGASLSLTSGQGVRIFSDGATYYTQRGIGGAAGGGSVFTGSTASTIASSATPAFSLADVTIKSPIRFEISPVVNVTGPTVTNKVAGARFEIAVTTDGTHTWSWNGIVADHVCPVYTAAAATTTATIEVGQDGATLHGLSCILSIAGDVVFGATVAAPSVAPGAGNMDCRLTAAGFDCLDNASVHHVLAVPKDCSTGGVNAVQKLNADGTITCVTLSVVPTTVIYTSQIAGIHADGSATTNAGTDDRATLQTVLNTASASTPLELVVDKGLLVIDSTTQGLVLNSYTKIRCAPGAGFSWKGSANANQKSMITNANPLGIAAPVDTAISMDGCYTNGNHDTGHGGSGQLFPNAMNSNGIVIAAIQIVGVTNLQITNHKSYKAAGYGIWIANATQFKLDNIRIEHTTGEFVTDGIHINGPASNFTIRNVSGFAGDDMIALNADDGHLANAGSGTAGIFGNNASASTIKNGAISACLVEGVHVETSLNLFRLLSAQSALSCTLRHLDGITINQLFVMDNDPTDFGSQPGWLGNYGTVVIEDVTITAATLPGCAVQLDAIFESLSMQIVNRFAGNPIWCTSSRTQIQDLRLDIKTGNIGLSVAEVLKVNGGSIASATITGTVDYANSGNATNPVVNVIAGQITSLKFLNFEADFVNNLAVVSGGLVHSIQFSGGHHKHAGGNPTLSIGSSGSVLNAGAAGFYTNSFQGGAGPAPVFLNGQKGDVVPDPSPIYNGATAFYRMTEATGATRADSSGFLRNESDVGSVPQVACGGGQSGNCASFANNASKYLTSSGVPFTINAATGVTAAGWVNFTALAAALQIVFAKLSEFNVYYENATNKLGVCVIGTCAYSATISSGTWYFVVAGWDPITTLPFISLNNSADNTGGAITPAVNNGNPMTFGIQSGSFPLNGTLGPWGFWGRKLSAAERTTLYNGGTFYDPTGTTPAGIPGTVDGSLIANTATGISTLRVCHITYSFAVDGGATPIVPAGNCTVPNKAVITNVSINSTTAVTAAGAATVAVGCTGGIGCGAASLMAATPKASLGTNVFGQSIPVPQTASTWVKTTAAGTISLTIATGPLTAGVIELYVFYFTSST